MGREEGFQSNKKKLQPDQIKAALEQLEKNGSDEEGIILLQASLLLKVFFFNMYFIFIFIFIFMFIFIFTLFYFILFILFYMTPTRKMVFFPAPFPFPPFFSTALYLL